MGEREKIKKERGWERGDRKKERQIDTETRWEREIEREAGVGERVTIWL